MQYAYHTKGALKKNTPSELKKLQKIINKMITQYSFSNTENIFVCSIDVDLPGITAYM